jgi:hydrogenase maturation factor
MTEAARVLEVGPAGEAIVEIRGTRRRLSVALLALEDRPVEPGEWVLASAGMAVERLEESEARDLAAFMERARNEGTPS